MDALTGFTETSVLNNGTIKHIQNKNNYDEYWNGSAWALSDGTYTEANTAAEINTNKATFTTIPIGYGIKSFLHSLNGDETPELNLLAIDFNYGATEADEIIYCLVSGYFLNNNPVKIELSNDFVKYKNNTRLNKKFLTHFILPNTNNEYKWQVALIETSNMSPSTYWNFNFGDGKIYSKSVPAQAESAYESLT